MQHRIRIEFKDKSTALFAIQEEALTELENVEPALISPETAINPVKTSEITEPVSSDGPSNLIRPIAATAKHI